MVKCTSVQCEKLFGGAISIIFVAKCKNESWHFEFFTSSLIVWWSKWNEFGQGWEAGNKFIWGKSTSMEKNILYTFKFYKFYTLLYFKHFYTSLEFNLFNFKVLIVCKNKTRASDLRSHIKSKRMLFQFKDVRPWYMHCMFENLETLRWLSIEVNI